MTSPNVLSGEHAVQRPLRADAERNRRRLLAAAREVFAERGLEATLDDVAARAGVGVGTAYRRFANKQQLIEGIFQERIDGIVGLAEECATVTDAWEGLVRFLEGTCAAIAADRGIRDILMPGDVAPGKGLATGKVAASRQRLLPATTRLIERAAAAGAIRPDFEPTDLPMIILMVEAVANATDRLAPDLWRRYLALILGALRTAQVPAQPLPGSPLSEERIEQVMTGGQSGRS